MNIYPALVGKVAAAVRSERLKHAHPLAPHDPAAEIRSMI